MVDENPEVFLASLKICRRILAPLGFSLLLSLMNSVMYDVSFHPSSKPFVLKVPTRGDDCLGRREELGGVESTTKSQRSLLEQDKCHPGVGIALGQIQRERCKRGHTTIDGWHFDVVVSTRYP